MLEKRLGHNSVFPLCCVISGSQPLTSLGLGSLICRQCLPHGPMTQPWLQCEFFCPQYWIPDPTSQGTSSPSPGSPTVPERTDPLHTHRLDSLCHERWEQKELELLPAPAVTSASALLCAIISPGIKWLLSQIKTQGSFKTWILIN